MSACVRRAVGADCERRPAFSEHRPRTWQPERCVGAVCTHARNARARDYRWRPCRYRGRWRTGRWRTGRWRWRWRCVTPPVVAPVVPVVPVVPVSPVPEPASWMLMIAGFGLAGGALRSRRRLTTLSGTMRAATVPWQTKAAGIFSLALPDTFGAAAVAGNSATLAKLALCVCPPALIMGSVATLPVARKAVHAATAPARSTSRPRRPSSWPEPACRS